ncbi:MAG: glycine cleavage system aminomethyltransferase GcvT [Candidatus Neomarinimicrobiota bacterium]
MKKTALHDRHVKLNAKIVPFAGYEMPVQYQGIIQEHLAVRTAAGLFDVSHMGEFIVTGRGAEDFLQRMTVNDVAALRVGQAQYSAMCYDDGGIVDDLLIYRYADHFMLVVNASNLDKDFKWLQSHLPAGVTLENRSDEISLIALQGPQSRSILGRLTEEKLAEIPFYHFLEGRVANRPVTIARTGYTGELGFELYGSNEDIPLIWDRLFEVGAAAGLVPVGLGARDTLRLEMKYCLYGNDIDQTTNPVDAGLSWIIKADKGDFIGKAAILARKTVVPRRLVCLEMLERAVPRHGYKVFSGAEEIGVVTSGTQSPSLQKGIALAYLNREFTKIGTATEVEIRGGRKAAVVVKPPFYQQGTAQD